MESILSLANRKGIALVATMSRYDGGWWYKILVTGGGGDMFSGRTIEEAEGKFRDWLDKRADVVVVNEFEKRGLMDK